MVKKRLTTRENFTYTNYFSPYVFANSLGMTCMSFIFIYAITVWLGIYNGSLFAELYPLSFSFSNWSLLIGLAQSYVFAYVFGWIFVNFYNKSFSRR